VTDKTYEDLMERAREARSRAYAPYSNFRVGAALLTAGGLIITGGNVENASYGLSMCAERAALFAALARGEREIRAIAVAADPPATPCGACRQVMLELAPEADVITGEEGRGLRVRKVRELLPHAFELKK
jgi:cytidine deaminase